MRFKSGVIFFSLLAATLFVLAVRYEWLRAIYYCEGFGCIGLGLLYIVIGAVVPVVFLVGGLLVGPAPRFYSGLFAGGVALLAMLAAFGVLYLQNQAQIERDTKAYHEACAEHPEICR